MVLLIIDRTDRDFRIVESDSVILKVDNEERLYNYLKEEFGNYQACDKFSVPIGRNWLNHEVVRPLVSGEVPDDYVAFEAYEVVDKKLVIRG